MPATVLRCADEKCGVIVQTSQAATAMVCPRCRKALGPMQRTSAQATLDLPSGTPVVLRCGDAKCGVIVRVCLAAGESLPCPGCRGVLAAVAQPVSATTPAPKATLDLPASKPGVTLDLPPTATPAPAAILAGLPVRSDESLPARIGRFEIRRFLGEGGFGRVYEAYDPSLKRQVALKVARPEQMQTRERIERFLREARSAGNLMHPHIVAVFDSGQDGPHHYIASAFVPGRSLDRVLQANEKGLKLEQAAAIVRKLAEALAYAHREGVVHRDVKPGNVMLRDDGEPMLMDFGLAARQEEGEERLTQGQVMMGTPAYMAPEQAQGNAEAASDQYSLGVALFELLTGQLPFVGGSPAHYMVLHETQMPPSLRTMRAEVPRDLEAICLKCLEKEPRKRYLSCQRLADDLRRWADSEPVRARLPGLGERVVKWAKRNPAVAGLMAVVVTTLLLGVSVATGLWMQASRALVKVQQERKRADAATENAKRDAEAARKARDEAKASEKLAKAQSYRSESALHAHQLYRSLLAREQGNHAEARTILNQVNPNFENTWEQRYARAFDGLRDPRTTLNGHKSGVRGVAISTDGNWIVSASEDQTVKVWDALTGKEKHSLTGHKEIVLSAAISPDGKWIVSGGNDKTVKVWDAQTGKELRTLTGHSGPVVCLAFSPDGKRVISGSGDATVKVWDVPSWEIIRTLEGHGSTIHGVAFSSDSKRIVSGSYDRTAKVWDAQTGEVILTFKKHPSHVFCVAFSPDGNRIVSGSYDKAVMIWDAQTGNVIRILKGHSFSVSSTVFNNDGKRVISASADNTVKVWDAETGQEKLTLRGHFHAVNSVVVSVDGQRIISGSGDSTVRVWGTETGQEKLTLKSHMYSVSSVAFSGGGERFVSGGLDGMVIVWDTQTGQEKHIIKRHTGAVFAVAFSPDGKRIASGSEDHTLKVWDAKTGIEVLSLDTPATVNSVAFRFDGLRIVSGCGDTVRVWDVRTGEIHKLEGHSGPVSGVAFSPNGNLIVSGSSDKTLKIWDAETGKEKATLARHSQPVCSVAFSPDGKWVVSGSIDRTVRLWEVETGKEKLTLQGHTDYVFSVAYSGTGKHIISGSHDNTVKVWNAQTGDLLFTFMGHTGAINAVACSMDGKRIVSGSFDDTVKVWDLEASELLR